jgi:hypothetical protein
MRNIQIIGSPFNVLFSSCGKRKPKKFIWTTQFNEIQVFVDNSLIKGCTLPFHNKKFGWFCESRIVKENIFNDIINNIKKYKNSYKKIFTCDRELISRDPDLFCFIPAGSNLPWTQESDYGIHTKTKLISLISSPKEITSGHRHRISLAHQFKGIVDFYGGIFNSEKIGIENNQHYHHTSKQKALNEYMFSVTIENFKYDDYFTEKITDCFANGVIPIYYGTENINKYFDSSGIIMLDNNFNINSITKELYYSKLESIKNNLEIIKNMESADDVLYTKILELI